jgi:predicted  nucleic acid-binding Zn-ribbon protein
VIEHPVRPGYSLVDTAKPVETARDVYRFELKLPATGSLELPVTEEHVYDRQTAVSSLNPPLLLTYIRNKNIPDAARRQLQQIADLKTRIADAESESGRLDTEIRNVSNDEERTRQNITSLSQVSGQQQLVQDYARKLADAETQIAALHARRKQSDDQRAAFQTQLNTAIGKLDF